MGVGRTDRQTDRCLWLLRRGCDYTRWTQAQHTEGLSGYLYHPALGRLPNTAASTHTHGGQRHRMHAVAPGGPVPRSLLQNRENPTSRAAAGRGAAGRAKVRFLGIARRWRVLPVAHRKCSHLGFTYFIHLCTLQASECC